jgi:hypothetical protein
MKIAACHIRINAKTPYIINFCKYPVQSTVQNKEWQNKNKKSLINAMFTILAALLGIWSLIRIINDHIGCSTWNMVVNPDH